jgi:formylglycine-generating enzyme required for sulfatase activity
MLRRHADWSTLLTLTVLGAVLLTSSCGGDKAENPNLEPTASFTVDPTAGTSETDFQVDASACSDAEDPVSALQVRWDWENDGTWDTDWSPTKTNSHQYGTAGTKTIKLEVKDTEGATDDTTRTVTVTAPNTGPTASFTVDPAAGPVETVFQFDASGSSDAEDPVSALQIRWDWENDGAWDTDWTTTKTASHQYASTGAKSIKLEVKDSEGATGQTTRGIVVTDGGPTPGEMVLVPAGSFTQGDGVAYCGVDQRQVTLTRSFYLGTCEVTNQEYLDQLQWAYNHGYVTATAASVRDNLDGSTQLLVDLSSGFQQISFDNGTFTVEPGRENYPVTSVCWFGAVAYCDWLSMNEGKIRAYNHSTWQCNAGNPYTADGYRLPTDAEWEYAAQYNDERIFPWGNEAIDCSRSNSTGCIGMPVPVASYPAGSSALGLYDMTGNVWEWCNDWEVCSLGTEPVTDPVGPASETGRVVHGGSYTHVDYYSRCAGRISYSPGSCYSYGGFRIARTQP